LFIQADDEHTLPNVRCNTLTSLTGSWKNYHGFPHESVIRAYNRRSVARTDIQHDNLPKETSTSLVSSLPIDGAYAQGSGCPYGSPKLGLSDIFPLIGSKTLYFIVFLRIRRTK
jgi:hypothetical protein